ncbi:MAG: class I SAM-dependent methyltransferase, partial [Endomicrobia bacterium]|nr:class I SAM-dependent methyltransferase [Endomicrobiia bacterium]
MKDAYNENKNKIWVDIGCGRGELIEILHTENIPYIGVDTNSVNIDICLKRGLNVIKEDVLSYLYNVEDNSLSGVSAIQVVEHLSREQ